MKRPLMKLGTNFNWVTENVCAMVIFHMDGPVEAQAPTLATVTQANIQYGASDLLLNSNATVGSGQ